MLSQVLDDTQVSYIRLVTALFAGGGGGEKKSGMNCHFYLGIVNYFGLLAGR